jgi:hypothetical protein
MTVPRADFDPHDLDRLQGVIVQMIRALPDDEREAVLDVVRAEPFSFTAKNAGEAGWFTVYVGEREPIFVGRCHVGALRRDDASAN